MTGTVAAPVTETGPGFGPILDPTEWLTVSGAAAAAGVLERTMRRWIAAGQVASRMDADGRRRVERASLPAPVEVSASDRDIGSAPPRNQRFVAATGSATDKASGRDTERDSGSVDSVLLNEDSHEARSVECPCCRVREEQVDDLRSQLEARTMAEAELRRLLLMSQQALNAAVERPALPAANIHSEYSAPQRLKWWQLWRRKV